MKLCPKCNSNHNKPGIFCSRSCANSRTFSVCSRRKKSEANKNFYKTENGKQKKENLAKKASEQIWTEESKQKISDTMKKFYCSEKGQQLKQKISERAVSEDTRKKMSMNAKKRNLGGHTSKRKIFFNKKNGDVVYLQSSFEIRFAQILEDLNISWERPEPFVWIDCHGIDHKYYPDFKIGDIYIDTKNDYLAVVDLPKIEAVRSQNDIDLRIVTESMINRKYIGSLV